jgi:peptidoglycan/xylan/chitin deacetylase (PgdA/CDA1 family)
VRHFRDLVLAGALVFPSGLAYSQDCTPDRLGTSRVMEVPFTQGPVGRASYRQTLPLEPGEVVLTFDDGPMPRRTPAVLEALRAECVKATFFVVGTMVAEFPGILRRTAAEGHTIATHTWSHAYLNRQRSRNVQRDQINGGLVAARTVLGRTDPALSPFFRYPGLGHTRALDGYVAAQRLIPFSIDVDGDDWRRITPEQVVERVLARLDSRGKGIVLLHDIQPRTVAILPELLRRLKAKGYRIVHVVPAAGDTRLALEAVEEPRARRIRLALDRLETREFQRVASAGGSFVPVTTAPAQVVRVASAGDEPLALRPALADPITPTPTGHAWVDPVHPPAPAAVARAEAASASTAPARPALAAPNPPAGERPATQPAAATRARETDHAGFVSVSLLTGQGAGFQEIRLRR